jgi:phage tail-like protein
MAGPQSPTSWLLDGPTGWRTATAAGVTVGEVAGIQLSATADGPLAPTSSDGSLGGLTLPAGMALHPDGTLYLLDPDEQVIKRFDPAARCFRRLPSIGRGAGEPREFSQHATIAIAGTRLYLADPGDGPGRVLVFALPGLVLLHLWQIPDWDPVDLAAHGRDAYILDRSHGRVFRHNGGTGELQLVVRVEPAAGRWTRLAVDRDGRLYLLDRQSGAFDVFDAAGRPQATPNDPGDLRDRFDPPPIRLNSTGRFCLPASLAQPCGRRLPRPGPPPEAPLALCAPGMGGLVFDLHGDPVVPADPPGPPLYQTAGTWISAALDSDIYRCQWHRIELELDAHPTGSQVIVSTYADERPLPALEIAGLPEDRWTTHHAVAAQTKLRPDARPPIADDLLVQSRAGQYLWIRLRLLGDGYGSPAARSLRVHYPRDSYLTYLPAVYSADDDGRWFLERFLSVFQTEWDAIEDDIEHIERLFDPRAVPGGKSLAYLAQWLALPLEGAWNDQQQRRLLVAAPDLYRRRGTPDGVRRHLRTYLENMTGLTLDDSDYPQLIEGFRERARLLLSTKSATLGQGAPLWSPALVGRLQLDVHAREGEARLVSTRDPRLDVFSEFAHRFRVFVPAAWVRTGDQERMVRRALDAEKPAHTSYDLCLVEPRFRVGIQSTVGLDTIVATVPAGRLACRHDRDLAPSLPPRHRLGFDTVLSRKPTDWHAPRIGPGLRLM